jgi:YfiH family protein
MAEAAGQQGRSAVEVLGERLVSDGLPRFELVAWKSAFGVVAGITGRGDEQGRGFDLGLWGDAPVGEVMSRWRAFRRSLPAFSSVVLGNQVHAAEVMVAPPSAGWHQVEGIDGWVTTSPGVLLTVTVADCVPVYLAAPGKGLALLHAGWRGTAAGILERGVERLLAATGASAPDIVMHCGIAICGECYEVGSEVMLGCGAPADGPGPWHLDLRDTLANQASGLGIGRLSVSAHCSAHDRPAFYSHRASRGTDGRMVAYLGMPAA